MKFFRTQWLVVMATVGVLLNCIFAPTAMTMPSPDSQLSWSHCIDLANQNNADLKTAASNVRANEQLIRSTWFSNYLPTIQGEYTLSRTSTDGVDADGSLATVSVNQNLLDGFKTTYTLKQNEAALRLSQAALKATRAAVSAELITAYEGLHYAKSYKKLTDNIIKRREENLRLVTLRFESGGENKGSVLLSAANLEQAKFDDLQASDAALIAQRQLAKVMGLDDHAAFEINEPVPLHDPEAAPDMQSLALETPDYLTATANVDNARAGVGLARQPFLPQLNLVGNMTMGGIEVVPRDVGTWYAGVDLKIPFLNPLGTLYGVKSASSTYSASESTRMNTARLLLVKLEQAYEAFVEAVAKFRVATAFKEAAGVRAEIARAKYKNGLMTFDDWDIIENDLIAREKDFVSSERDRVNAESAWSQAQGKGVL